MRRRRFITLVGIGAAGALAGRPYPGLAGVGLRWQADGVGSVARIGVSAPDFDPVPESEMCAGAMTGAIANLTCGSLVD